MRALALLFWAVIALWPSAAAAQGPIEAKVSEVKNNFPEDVLFKAEASSTAGDIRALALRIVVGSGPAERIGTIRITPGPTVQGEFQLKTSGNNYIAPGADFTYWLVVEDNAGNKLETEKKTFWYQDTRFQWQRLQEGPVEVSYYGGVHDIARSILSAARGTQEKVGRMLGTEAQPFRVMLYNNVRDLLGAQQQEASETRRRELIAVGRAYSGEDLVQMLGGGSLGAADTARHEITHLFVHWAAGANVPAWLNEGLAVWSQSDPGDDYIRLLNRGITFNELLLLRGLDNFPGRSEENLLAYGQSYSVVKYLIDTYGPQKLRQLFEAIRAGEGAANGLRRIYSLSLDGLDAEWRKHVGAPPRSYAEAVPNVIAIPTIVPIGAAPAQSNTSGPSAQRTPGAAAGPQLFPIVGGVLAVLVLAAGGFVLVRRR